MSGETRCPTRVLGGFRRTTHGLPCWWCQPTRSWRLLATAYGRSEPASTSGGGKQRIKVLHHQVGPVPRRRGGDLHRVVWNYVQKTGHRSIENVAQVHDRIRR